MAQKLKLRQAQLFGTLPQNALLRALSLLHTAPGQTNLSRLSAQRSAAPLKEQLRALKALTEQQNHGGRPLPKGPSS
jgi:hypothetical protein